MMINSRRDGRDPLVYVWRSNNARVGSLPVFVFADAGTHYKVPTAHCAMPRNPEIIRGLHCLSEDRTPMFHWR